MKTLIAMMLLACGGSTPMSHDAGRNETEGIYDYCKKWNKICKSNGNGTRDCLYYCVGF